MKISILGGGCPKCRQLEENTRKALHELNKTAEIVKVTGINDIVGYGVMSTPAIVIDGKVKSYGKVADVEEIKGWLK